MTNARTTAAPDQAGNSGESRGMRDRPGKAPFRPFAEVSAYINPKCSQLPKLMAPLAEKPSIDAGLAGPPARPPLGVV